jgi:hypothetical protein
VKPKLYMISFRVEVTGKSPDGQKTYRNGQLWLARDKATPLNQENQ